LIRVLEIFSKALGLIPRSLLMLAGTAVGLFWFHILRFRRSVIFENLRHAFGSQKTESEIYQIARGNSIHYGKTIIDFLLSVGWNKKQAVENIPLSGEEHLKSALAKGRGVYMLCMHSGAWEFSMPALSARGYPFDVVVKRAKSPRVNELIVWYRAKTGTTTFAETRTTSQIFQSLTANRAVGFVLDQFMGPPIGLPVKFFGQVAGTAAALALFSEKRDAPVLLLYNYRDAAGRPRSVIEPAVRWHDLPQDKTERLYYKTQVFNDMIERVIRQYPDQWLWLHRRWKAFNGEPKWQLKALAPVMAALLFAFAGCSSSPTTRDGITSPTGQGVPEEPTVAIPQEAPTQDGPLPTEEAPVEKKPEPPKTDTKAKKKKTSAVEAKPEKKLVKRSFNISDLPFEVGERQVIELNWTMIPAGRITLEVRPGGDKLFNGRPTFHFWGSVRSSKIVDTMYRINNTIQSYVDKEWFLPYKFLLTMDEKMQYKETRAVFDHTKNKAYYWSDRKSERWGNEVQNREDTIAANAIDMYSAIYYARILNLKIGETQEFAVYENNKNLTVTLTPVASELVATPVGTFQCLKIRTIVHLNNVLKPTGDMFVWLSDDFKKYVVKFDATLKIGSLRGTLVELRDRSLAGK